MKNLIFNNYPTTVRKDIVIFSLLYEQMVEEIKSKLKKGTIELHLGRISDVGISITPPIHFFNIVSKGENEIAVNYYGDLRSEDGKNKLPMEKTIRFDNPFGEIPILPGYEQLPKFFDFGNGLDDYRTFVEDVRKVLFKEIGNDIQLRYKNDDGTFSVINGTVKVVNKSNILTDDFSEILVEDNKSKRVDPLFSRHKNHRFISEKGYLCWICQTHSSRTNMFDDGEVGQSPSWNFKIEKAHA